MPSVRASTRVGGSQAGRQAAIADARLQDAIQLLMRRLPELELAQHEVRQSGRGQRRLARRLGIGSRFNHSCGLFKGPITHHITSGHAPGTAKKSAALRFATMRALRPTGPAHIAKRLDLTPRNAV